MKKNINLPEIGPDIYRSKNVEEIVLNHIETLSQNPSTENMLLKNKLQEYLFFISNKKMKNRARKTMSLLHENAVKQHPDLSIETFARIKSFISTYNKCRIKLYSGKSLDSIKDIYACRTIIDSNDGKDSLKLVKKAYQIMDENIDYLISIGLIPCNAEKTKDTEEFNKNDYPNIIVPDKSYLSEKNKPFVKDYFLHPKKKGYQSLHVIFKDTYGNYFEYQVRTYSMDVWAEYQDASHESFKLQQIKDIPEIKLEREKVNLSFYRTINNEVIADKSGFERSIQILFLKDLVEKHI